VREERPASDFGAAALLGTTIPSVAQQSPNQPVDVATATNPAIEAYIRARTAFEQEAEAYWQSVTDKRRARFGKRNRGERIALDDYVVEQPPVYAGPPRPPGYVPPQRDPASPFDLRGLADHFSPVVTHRSWTAATK